MDSANRHIHKHTYKIQTHKCIHINMYKYTYLHICRLSCWLSGKESACQAGDMGLIPRSGRSPGEGNSNPLQYSFLGNPMDRGAWRLQSMGSQKESDTTKWLNNNKYTNTHIESSVSTLILRKLKEFNFQGKFHQRRVSLT